MCKMKTNKKLSEELDYPLSSTRQSKFLFIHEMKE